MSAKKAILFLGASITQGSISVSYVKMLKEMPGMRQCRFLNQGVAGYESFNVWMKIEKAVHAVPDAVIILLGTNDVLSSLDPRLGKISRKLKHIPHEPTLSHYSQNMTLIVQYLKQNTHSRIALASLPILGEDLDSADNKEIANYNAELERIAHSEKVTYLPVNEKQREYLNRTSAGQGKGYDRAEKLAYKSLLQHHLLFRSLDAIGRKNGYHLLTDGIHLNSAGARIVADLTEEFIRRELFEVDHALGY